METNCPNDDSEWGSKQEPMKFDDDQDTHTETNPISSAIALIRIEFPDITSMSSFDSTSDTSSVVSDDGERLRELPAFVFSKSSGENQYQPRAELRVASLKTSNNVLSPKSDESGSVTISNSIKLTIQGFLLGQEVSLEGFRSLTAKKALLAKAMETNDGNAIIAITLFLQQTLRESLFQLILMENKAAANHYIRYLETRSETGKLVDLLCMLGRTQDALILRYKTILRGTNLDRIQSQLSHFYAAECSNTDEYMAALVQSHLNVVETHKVLLPQGKSRISISGKYPSVMLTLRHLSEHFYDKDATFALSPLKFSTTHNLTRKQYAWSSFLGLVKVQKWPQIESLLIKKGWMGSYHGILPADDVCKILKENDAPIDLLSMFVSLIDNPESKLTTAKNLHCHKVVIDVYAAKKDKSSILLYKEKLEEKSKDAVYAETVLRNMK